MIQGVKWWVICYIKLPLVGKSDLAYIEIKVKVKPDIDYLKTETGLYLSKSIRIGR